MNINVTRHHLNHFSEGSILIYNVTPSDGGDRVATTNLVAVAIAFWNATQFVVVVSSVFIARKKGDCDIHNAIRPPFTDNFKGAFTIGKKKKLQILTKDRKAGHMCKKNQVNVNIAFQVTVQNSFEDTYNVVGGLFVFMILNRQRLPFTCIIRHYQVILPTFFLAVIISGVVEGCTEGHAICLFALTCYKFYMI